MAVVANWSTGICLWWNRTQKGEHMPPKGLENSTTDTVARKEAWRLISWQGRTGWEQCCVFPCSISGGWTIFTLGQAGHVVQPFSWLTEVRVARYYPHNINPQALKGLLKLCLFRLWRVGMIEQQHMHCKLRKKELWKFELSTFFKSILWRSCYDLQKYLIPSIAPCLPSTGT